MKIGMLVQLDFCSTFGAKYFGGYARSKKDKFNGEKSYLAIKNLKKQSVNFDSNRNPKDDKNKRIEKLFIIK